MYLIEAADEYDLIKWFLEFLDPRFEKVFKEEQKNDEKVVVNVKDCASSRPKIVDFLLDLFGL